MTAKKSKNGAAWVARQLGWDCECNGGHWEEYKEQIAHAYGAKSWAKLKKDLQREAWKAFLDGKREEREAKKS